MNRTSYSPQTTLRFGNDRFRPTSSPYTSPVDDPTGYTIAETWANLPIIILYEGTFEQSSGQKLLKKSFKGQFNVIFWLSTNFQNR